MLRFFALAVSVLTLANPCVVQAQTSYINFESGQVRPLALSPNGLQLFAVNTPDNSLEIFDVDGAGLTHVASVGVGMEPVAVAAHSNTEVWVVNHLSDSISIVDVGSSPARVTRTLLVGDEPRDIVFAGVGTNTAFITTAHRGQHRTDGSIAAVTGAGDPQFLTDGIGRADVWVFDATSLGATIGGTPSEILTLFTDTPRALAVSADGNTVYAAGLHTGNQTTALSEGLVCNGFDGAGTCAGDGITSPGGLGGGLMPGGNPGPDANVEGVGAPEVGLIVKFNRAMSTWEDELGRNWNNAVRFDLPDEDVFAIDVATLSQVALHAHVGTTLFNMVVNPSNGDLYVSNTEAVNEVRFEGPGVVGGSTVQGRLAEARVTVIDNPNLTDVSGLSVKPRHLNSHIDYDSLAHEPGFDPSTKLHSLAIPVDMAVDSGGTTLYVAAFGSSRVGVLDTATLEAGSLDPTLASANYIDVSGGGPSGLALDEANNRLYVLTRFDNSVAVVDLATSSEAAHISLHNPEPAGVIAGRPFLYDAFATSANGETSCASCHIFGDMDHLAWELGNPDDDVSSNVMNIRLKLGAGPEVNGEAELSEFHPMKGPMTTQTLRGLAHSGPMHWRGDRSSGFFGPGVGEPLSFDNFIVAFEGLVGRAAILAEADMHAFTDFALTMTLPPNPVRALDNSLTVDEQAGRDFYLGPRLSDGVNIPDLGFTCNGCHTLDAAQGFFGTNGDASFENETQIMKIAHLRNLYQKVGMFGLADVPFLNAGDNSHKGDQVRGFGFLHDGSVDTIFRFFDATVFNNTGAVGFDGPSGGDVKRREMERFMLAFDSDLAPIVGQQVTLDHTNSGVVGPRIDLLIQRAMTPFTSAILGPSVAECDLIMKGIIDTGSGAEVRGAVMLPGGDFASDRAADATLTDGQVRTFAATAGQPLTYTCVPPGSGVRMGIDRDEDGVLDGDDNCPSAVNANQADADVDLIGDVCDPDPGEIAMVQGSEQQKCITALNKGLAKVAKTHGKVVGKCMKDAAKDSLEGLVEDCSATDARGKLARAATKAATDEENKCTVVPSFGPSGSTVVVAAAEQGNADLYHDMFGPDLDVSAIPNGTDDSRCQLGVAKKVTKCRDIHLKVFNKCKKKGLKDESIDTTTALQACVDDDASGKIANACDAVTGKVAGSVDSRCTAKAVDLLVAFPGCESDDPAIVNACLQSSARCRVCQTLNAADGLDRDCDDFDDATANSTCL